MIGFAGLSHLGINYSHATIANDFNVIGYDPDPALCESLKAGKLPIEEPGLQDLADKHGDKISYTSTAEDLTQCDLIFFALDIKTDENNQSDTGPLLDLFKQVVPLLNDDTTIACLSQVTPGFTRELCKDIDPEGRLNIYYQVETLIFGKAVERALYPERYIIGSSNPDTALPTTYKNWLEAFSCPLLLMRYESAELAKIAINFYLVSTVTTTNTLAEVCENIGADWAEIVPALQLDKRIGKHAYLKPGLGIAGGNLERDLMTVKKISDEHDTDSGTVDSWIHNSLYRKEWAGRTTKKLIPEGSTLACLGLAYKEDTHSIKNSPAVHTINQLNKYRIKAFDPAVKSLPEEKEQLTILEDEYSICEDADALLVLTPWKQFKEISGEKVSKLLKGKIVIDPYGILDEAAYTKAGLKYYTLGKSEQKT